MFFIIFVCDLIKLTIEFNLFRPWKIQFRFSRLVITCGNSTVLNHVLLLGLIDSNKAFGLVCRCDYH